MRNSLLSSFFWLILKTFLLHAVCVKNEECITLSATEHALATPELYYFISCVQPLLQLTTLCPECPWTLTTLRVAFSVSRLIQCFVTCTGALHFPPPQLLSKFCNKIVFEECSLNLFSCYCAVFLIKNIIKIYYCKFCMLHLFLLPSNRTFRYITKSFFFYFSQIAS